MRLLTINSLFYASLSSSPMLFWRNAGPEKSGESTTGAERRSTVLKKQSRRGENAKHQKMRRLEAIESDNWHADEMPAPPTLSGSRHFP